MRSRFVTILLEVVLLAGVLSAIAPAHAHDDQTIRSTSLGLVRGVDQSRSTGTLAWLGIPYAEPPTGELRWRAPVPHRPWQGVRDAREFGDGCIQEGRMFSPAPSGPHYGLDIRDGLKKPVGAEDCLTLNVFRPSTRERDLPVIVFIHGGSNMVGYSADPMYDGRALARKANAVVVTVNYRLGVFGWLDLPGLKTGDPHNDSGNFGTLDQVESLRFVNRNARAFGGDPSNVTVMGESAGAVNVWALMVSPLSKGLIDKAIPLSGGLQFSAPSAARTYAEAFADEAAGSDGDAADTVRRLRSMPAEEIIRAQVRRGAAAGDPPRVIADGVVLPEDYHAAIAAGDYRDIPVLAGNTLEEGKLFGSAIGAFRPTDYERFTVQYQFDPNRRSRLTVRDFIVDRYLPATRPGGWNDAADELTDSIFTGLIHDSMNSVRAAGSDKLFYYQFGWNQQPAPFDTVYGAVHAIDLPFLFHTFDDGFFSFSFSHRNEPGRLRLSDLMIDSVRTFVRTGTPQHAGLGATWEQWPRSMMFDAGDRKATARPGSVERQAPSAAHGG
ncbi:carboxylesterase/lipase family protein [Prauserella muralis]|uniref:Carboxylic ester hydrolase n=1 Tax=Prauserella muralis TaxID=588067 RepID=A0A2V4B327_9PSEU|nr:carboxylesterase family protein [Prauserella muralis]PXY27798.1 carboxylesterase [Prauserella muralis]TWE22443.1 para-nitrobenzyl esterase [Prauserella muralis]